jgi:hypothetical protein
MFAVLYWLMAGTYRKTVESQFKKTWKGGTTCPEVKAIYKVIVAEASLKQYKQYL